MRIAQINVVASLSTGRIAVSLCRTAMQAGHRALICHSRDHAPADVPSYVVGSKAETLLDLALTRLTDRAGFFSRYATRRLIRQLDAYKPDLVHLHNLHGYYLNLPMLFAWLRKHDLPVVWTLHDCWAYTGTLRLLHHGARRRAGGRPPPPGRPEGPPRLRPLAGGRAAGDASGGMPIRPAGFWTRARATGATSGSCSAASGTWCSPPPASGCAARSSAPFSAAIPSMALPNGVDLTVFQPCSDEQFMRDVARFYGAGAVGGPPPGDQRRGRVGRAQGAGRPD